MTRPLNKPMKTSALAAVALFLLLAPTTSNAQQLNLQLRDGLVTLDAQNVPIRQILSEWARVGGTRIVNGEKITGAPVTLQLSGVPERQALDTILRGVSGYMLASRQAGMPTGASSFDRILILPTSSAPRVNQPAPAVTGFAGPRQMPVQAEPVDTEMIEDADNDEPLPEDEGGEEVQPQPNMNPRFQRRFQNPMGVQGQPYMPPNFPQQPINDEEGQPQQPAVVAPIPGNPFGLPPGASTTPGVVTPVPQQDPNNPQQRRPPQ
jgi:hypothetical protein